LRAKVSAPPGRLNALLLTVPLTVESANERVLGSNGIGVGSSVGLMISSVGGVGNSVGVDKASSGVT
jgi:hypothetical protein